LLYCSFVRSSMTRSARIVAATAISTLCLGTAVAAFWYQDWSYSLPTPRPEGLRQPALGTPVDVVRLLGTAPRGRGLAVHVVDPDCPCSRFNRDHLRSLVRRFGDRLHFVVLVQGGSDPAALRRSFESWDIPATVIADPGGRRASRLGVYSTPQAVIIDADDRLFFRGNYNSSRYCVDKRTEFTRIAIEAVLAGEPLPAMPSDARVAYGCPLHRPTTAPTL
jgi:hypothetical protein